MVRTPQRHRHVFGVGVQDQVIAGSVVLALVLSVFAVDRPVLAQTPSALLIQEMAEIDDMARRRELCVQVLGNEPKRYAIRFCEGYDAIFVGLHDEARRALEDALAEQSRFALAAILYAEAYESLNDPARAEFYYERAIEVQPQRTDARFALGSLYLRQAEAGDEAALPKALEAFRQMAEVAPHSPDGFNAMAHVLALMGRTADAETLYRRAIEKNPSDPFLYDNLAALYAREGASERAKETWETALRVNPGYGPAVIELAALHGRQGRLVEAVRVLESGSQAVVAPPWGPRIRRNLGFAFLGMDRVDRARNLFIEAVTSGSEDPLSHLGLAHLRMIEGNTQAALTAFRRAAALDPALTAAFVFPWKSTVKFALEENETGPLQEVIADLDSGARTPSLGPDVRTGPEATPALVTYVLEEWDFTDADLAVDQLESGADAGDTEAFDGAPVPLKKVPAEYPDRAQELGLEGEVMVHVTIDESGQVVEARIESSTADRMLNDSALAAARAWEFRPATRYGSPVRSSIVIPFRFSRQ